MMQTDTTFTARYAETDQMGIVHHSNYAVWFEVGRTDFLKRAGTSNTFIEAQGAMLPLYEMTCKFLSPAKYEDDIVVTTTLTNLTKVRVQFAYQVKEASSNRLLASGVTSHAWTDKKLKPVNAGKVVPAIFQTLDRLYRTAEPHAADHAASR